MVNRGEKVKILRTESSAIVTTGDYTSKYTR